MVNIKKGITSKPAVSEILIHFFEKNTQLNGVFYIGYPILFAAGEATIIDALWLSPEYGIIIFDLIEGTEYTDRKDLQDKLYGGLESQLTAYPALKNRRQLAVNIEVITFAPACAKIHADYLIAFNEEDLLKTINELDEWENSNLSPEVISVIQSAISLRTKTKRENVKKENSRGAKLKRLEDTIATLDNDQEEAVIEFFDGLQRIRGLAGSGKTIVLALKAAYLHSLHSDWNIAVTFNTRALKDQFRDLISRFVAEKKRDLPDWEKIKIINAWGSPLDKPNERGLYYDFCYEHGTEYFDFRRAEALTFQEGKPVNQAFELVCNKALTEVKVSKEKYDAILVDEAQDLSEAFLNLCYKFLKRPKRLIYAYDELQKLNEGSPLRSPRIIFNSEAQDTILKKCYRNSRPLLVTAHSLGFGIYRTKGLVQFFDQPQLWKDVGYMIKEGELKHGSPVILARNNDSSPEYLEDHSDIDDLLLFKSFSNNRSQAEWIASEIEKNIKEDELLHKDIIVINPMAKTTEKKVAEVRALLLAKGINSHIAGKFDPNKFFENNSVAFTGINRAKGNEVSMVYIINADDCYSDSMFENFNLIKRRNILFTAITRSKAWVRVCGVGDRMDKLAEEFKIVKNKNFELDFKYPTEEEIEKMNLIHRDISQSEKEKIKEDENILKEALHVLRRIEDGDAHIEDFSEDIQIVIKSMMAEDEE